MGIIWTDPESQVPGTRLIGAEVRVREFICPHCGAPHLRELPPLPKCTHARFSTGVVVGVLIAFGVWFVLVATWVGP
jgi:hypothetical protein